jgi:hypothetical protein
VFSSDVFRLSEKIREAKDKPVERQDSGAGGKFGKRVVMATHRLDDRA